MFHKDTVLTYKVTRNVDGRQDGAPYLEEHRVVSDDGNVIRFSVSSENGEGRTYSLKITDDGCTIDRTDFTKTNLSPIQIELEDCLVYVDVLNPPMRCGGGETVYLGRDGVIYRDIKIQMWSMGVICKDVYNLISINTGGKVFDNIRWIEESEPEETVDSARDEIEAFKRRMM